MVVSLKYLHLRKLKLPLPFSVSPSDDYLIVKACCRNIMDRAIPVNREIINLEFLIGPFFQDLL